MDFLFVAKRFEYNGRYHPLNADLIVKNRPVGSISVTEIFNHDSKKLEVLATLLKFPVYAGEFLNGEPKAGEFVHFDIHLKTIRYFDRYNCEKKRQEMVAFNVCSGQRNPRRSSFLNM
jgi:hypothetical protein